MIKKPKAHFSCGLLIANLGTPDAPTASAVRRHLAEFLWDPRVVQIFRPLWWLILHLIILRIRPRKSAEAYAKVWTKQGSPLRCFTEEIAAGVHQELLSISDFPVKTVVGMRYGTPSISGALQELRYANCEHVVVLPLYPQYAAATIASVFDEIGDTFKHWQYLPQLNFISGYHDNEDYIQALANRIRNFWKTNGKAQLLLLSFHGLPERSRAEGDPYFDQCQETGELVIEKLSLNEPEYKIVFQSRFGREEWLKPYCIDVLKELPKQGITEVDVVCPGFAADCLETLEEIAITNKQAFLEAGGVNYRYITALNNDPEHVKGLARLVTSKLSRRSNA